MAISAATPLRSRVLVVDDELARLDTALGRAVESLSVALEERSLDVVRAISLQDGMAIVGSDASLRAVLVDWNLGSNSDRSHAQAATVLNKFRERHEGAPVFLVADRERT